jgi:hypothetical protein
MRTHLAVVGVGALLLCGAPAAHANTAPAPCNGVAQINDPPGDSHHPNVDVTRAWFHRADDGAVTVNIKVANLGPAIDHAENDRVLWRAIYSAGGQRRYVQATFRRGQAGATYEHGIADGFNTTKQGDTTGALFAGKSGVVQIAVPSAPAGTVLGTPVVVGAEANAVETTWFERAPGGDDPADPAETSTGSDYRVAPCGGGGGGAASGGSAGGGAPSAGGGSSAAAGAPGGISGVTLSRAKLDARYGQTVEVGGSVSPAVAGVAVEVLDDAGKTRSVLTTDAAGRFGFRVRVRRTAQLKVRAQGLTSAPIRVVLVPELALAAPRAVAGGVRFTGVLFPQRTGVVLLERRTRDGWTLVRSARARGGRFAMTVRGARAGRYRAVLDTDQYEVTSKPRRIR